MLWFCWKKHDLCKSFNCLASQQIKLMIILGWYWDDTVMQNTGHWDAKYWPWWRRWWRKLHGMLVFMIVVGWYFYDTGPHSFGHLTPNNPSWCPKCSGVDIKWRRIWWIWNIKSGSEMEMQEVPTKHPHFNKMLQSIMTMNLIDMMNWMMMTMVILKLITSKCISTKRRRGDTYFNLKLSHANEPSQCLSHTAMGHRTN